MGLTYLPCGADEASRVEQMIRQEYAGCCVDAQGRTVIEIQSALLSMGYRATVALNGTDQGVRIALSDVEYVSPDS